MRRILTAFVLSLPLLAGCGLMGGNRHCGVHVELLLPASVDTQTPILVQNTGQALQSHPIGTLAGPVLEGQSITGPVAPIQTVPAPMPQLRRGVIGDPCAPQLQQQGWYRMEDIQKLQQIMNSKQPPTANAGQEE